MPAEKVYDRENGYTVRVAWSKDQTVQIATLHHDGARKIIGIVNGWLSAHGEKLIDTDKILADTPDGNSATWDGWHATLDRPAVNALIRFLRQARDSAFGRDE